MGGKISRSKKMTTQLPDRLTPHNTSLVGRCVTIRYKGHELHNVVEADLKEQWVEVCVIAPNGLFKVDANGEVVTQRMYGKVEAEFAP